MTLKAKIDCYERSKDILKYTAIVVVCYSGVLYLKESSKEVKRSSSPVHTGWEAAWTVVLYRIETIFLLRYMFYMYGEAGEIVSSLREPRLQCNHMLSIQG